MHIGDTFYYIAATGRRLAGFDSDAPAPPADSLPPGQVAVHTNRNWDGAVTIIGAPADIAAYRQVEAQRDAEHQAAVERRHAEHRAECDRIAAQIGALTLTVVDQLAERPSCKADERHLAVAQVAGIDPEVIVGRGATPEAALIHARHIGASAVAAAPRYVAAQQPEPNRKQRTP